MSPGAARDTIRVAELDAVTDATLLALRAFVGVALRSVEGSPVTLVQYRVLALLAEKGTLSPGALAHLLDVDPSTVTRMCDRLVGARLITRTTDRRDRRSVKVALTQRGAKTANEVTRRRRSELSRVLGGMPPDRRAQLVELLGDFAAAAQDGRARDTQPGTTMAHLLELHG
jgi:DNA-binding MarR family transcriptional regulator